MILENGAWRGKIFTGEWRDSGAGTIEDVEPATGGLLAEVGTAVAADVARSCALAAEAQPGWAERPGEERGRVLLGAADLLEQSHDELAEWIVRETGGVAPKAEIELADAGQRLRNSAAIAGEESERELATAQPDRRSVARRVPLGVVGVITPFNFPLILSIRAVAPALATGNAVVLKPDPRTPVCGGILIAAALEQAGLPKGVLHVLPGGAETGSALVEDPNTQMIHFTGSTVVGRRIGATAGGRLKRVSLELGANSPFLVLEGADVETAAAAGAFASFFHQGQICMATGRHLVHESLAGDYVEALTEKAAGLRVGDPFREEVELGPLIDETQVRNVHRLVSETMAAGATATTGGEFDRLFYRPTVLTGFGLDAPAYREEVFGPVAPVATFADDEEAVALANDGGPGLKAAVHGGDYEHAAEVARRLRAGAVHVNDVTVNDEASAPFPAIGASGNQTAVGGPADAAEFTRWLWLTAREAPRAMPL